MAANDLGAGAAIFVSLAGAVAAAGVAAAFVAWRRRLLSIKEFSAAVGLTVVGAILLALLAPGSEPKPEPKRGPPALPAGLAQRADALLAQALAPNSPLACIDAVAGDQVEAGCEAVLFGRPETIAAAVSYVAAEVALLSQSLANSGGDDHALVLLRRHLAADRYGIVAHVLATTAGCNAERCNAFGLVGDASRIKSNLRDGIFDRLVAKYAAEWPAAGERSPAAADAGEKAPNAAASRTGKPVSSRYDFPSAASIPPVSIMVPEDPRGGSGEGRVPAPKPAPEPRPAATRPPANAAPTAPPPASPLPNAATGSSQDE